MTDETIITALISNPNIKEAAKSLQITTQAIYKRLKDDGFKEKYAEARKSVLEYNCWVLQLYISDAIEEMHRIIMDQNVSTQIRLNACDAIIRHCYRMTELTEVLPKLEKFEKMMGDFNECKTES